MSLEQKYEVRKILAKSKNEIFVDTPLEEEEFFVILRQDVLATTALWTYVNALRTAVDTLKLAGGIQFLENVRHLEEKANNIAQLASLWEQSDLDKKKLPD